MLKFSRASLVVVTLVGCNAHKVGESASTPTAGDPGQVLATIDGQAITVTDLQERINHQPPYVRARYAAPERKKELLESLVQFEVMAAEARSRGYDKDPDVVRVMKQTMISEFMKRDFDAKMKAEDVPDTEVEAYFREHPTEFSRPEEVRISAILTKDKGKAAKAAAEAKAASALDQKAFRDLVTKYSEDQDSKQRGGDLTFFDKGTKMYPKALVDAAFALKEVGDVSAPVPTERGFLVLKLAAKRPGFSRPLAEVKTQIQRQIYNQQRGKRLEEFTAQMRKRVKIETFPDKLAQVVIDPGPATPAPAPAKGPTP